MTLYFLKIWSSSTQGCFMPSLVETGPVVLEKKVFKYSPYIFIILLLSPLEEGCGPLFVKIWIQSTQGCFVSNLVVIGQVVFKRGFLNIFNIILLFHFTLPFEKAVALHLNKLESPPLKDVLCKVWLKLTKLFWIRRFLNIFNIILIFCYYLPLEKGVALHLKKLESPSSKDTLC